MWIGTENQIELLLIRHGETASNKEHRYLGRTDEPLSKEGMQRLLQSRNLKAYPSVDMVFSSPMKRCLQTVTILYPDKHPNGIAEWKEMDFGLFEGKNYEGLKEDKWYQEWIDSRGTLPFPQGESREEFVIRCEKGMEEMLRQLDTIKGQTGSSLKRVGAIVHGGTIMALLSRLYGGDYFDYQIPNGSGYLCRLTETEGVVRIQKVERL